MTINPPIALRIGLFGAGRVASQLAPALVAAGHRLAFVWSRTAAAAEALAATLPGTPALATLASPLPPADVYLLAVPDAAVAPLLARTTWPAGALVVHLAGAFPYRISQRSRLCAAACSTRSRPSAPAAPSTGPPCRCASKRPIRSRSHATGAGRQPQPAHAVARLGPAPEAARSRRVCQQFHQPPVGHCRCLAGRSRPAPRAAGPAGARNRGQSPGQPAFSVQTGPAVRRDAPTLAAHQAALAAHPAWQALYAQLTASIQAQL